MRKSIIGPIYQCKARCGARAQSVTVNATGCGFHPHTDKCNIYLNLYFLRLSAALHSATQHAMSPEFGVKGERSVSTLGPLCIPCVRGTA